MKIYDPEINEHMARRYDLSQNRSLFVVTDSYAVHTNDWASALQKQIQKKLWKMAAVIAGPFNTCNGPVQTKFAEEMKEMSAKIAGVDCDKIEGPSIAEISKAYDGPLGYVSMFATYRHNDAQEAHDMMVELQRQQDESDTLPKRPLTFVNARHYVDAMGVECGSALGDKISDCINNSTAAQYYHRCTGDYGGHPDLIAWDLIQFVWKSTMGA